MPEVSYRSFNPRNAATTSAGRGPAVHRLRRRVGHRPRQASGHRRPPDLQELVGHAAQQRAVARARPRRRAAGHPHPPRQGHVRPRRRGADAGGARRDAARRSGRPCPQGIPRRRAGHARARARTIALPLGRDPADRRRVVVTDDGAPSETRYEVMATPRANGRRSCAASSSPDARIRSACTSRRAAGRSSATRSTDEPNATIARQALHAWRVRCRIRSRDSADRVVEAPMPDDMSLG